MSKIKERIIEFINGREAVNKEDIKTVLAIIYNERGLKPYDGSLSLWQKRHWKTKNKMTIYKTDCPSLPQSLHIYLSTYGIGNKAMFYTIDGVEFNALTREEEREVKIWQDLNDGIVGKTYY